MDGAATEKHRSTRVLDLATVRGTVSCGMLLDLRVLPTARLVTKSIVKVARRVITVEGPVHHSKYVVFDALVGWQPMEVM